MAGHMSGDPSRNGLGMGAAYMVSQNILEGPQACTPKWYFSRQEIEDRSPSKKDGIDFKKETQFRKSYCFFLQELGMKLKVPQVTIATAMMFCHRFYLFQSHAKNDWQAIATVSMFLACKSEETPRMLKDVVIVAYETMYRKDPAATQRIKQKDVYEKQKNIILIGERLLLATIAFNLNIQHPYKPLVAALKRLNISNNDLVKVAWNFVNDWLWTTLCLEYKPQYIAAGSLFLAAKFQKVKLPSDRGKVWWLEFDVSPKLLEEVIQQMLRLLEQNRKKVMPSVYKKVNEASVAVENETAFSPQSCVLSGSVNTCNRSQGTEKDAAVVDGHMKFEDTNVGTSQNLACGSQISDCGSTTSVVEDSDVHDEVEVQPRTVESCQISSCKIVTICEDFGKIDKDRIREALKRRRCHRATSETVEDTDVEAWIERELETGIELEVASVSKKQKNAS